MHTKGGLWPPQESCYLRGHRQGGTHRRRCLHKAVHTKGGLWPPQESCYLRGHRQGGTHRRRCPHKAVHTKGRLWPPQESCYLRGHKQGGTHRRRCQHQAVHTKGGLWPPQESCYLRGHRQGGTHRRRCAQKAAGGSAGRFWPVGQPPGGSAGWRAGRTGRTYPAGGVGKIFGRNSQRRSRPADFGWPDRRQAVRPADSSSRIAAEFFGRGPPPSPTAVLFRLATI